MGTRDQLAPTPLNGEISPDGRWLAYESNESGGEFQIFVRPFPDVQTGGRWQVSTGVQPLWSRDGRELFYLAANGALTSVRVEPGTTWTAGTPIKVIDAPYFRGGGSLPRTYDVSRDGQRF